MGIVYAPVKLVMVTLYHVGTRQQCKHQDHIPNFLKQFDGIYRGLVTLQFISQLAIYYNM